MAMRVHVACALLIPALLGGYVGLGAQHRTAARPDLQGTWNGSTLTPLQRPANVKDKTAFTSEEAAEYVRSAPDRARSRLLTSADQLTQADVDEIYVEVEAIRLDGLRTSLIVDPPTGMLPPRVPAVAARIEARPKRSFDDPETLSLSERCLLGNFGLGGSMASPPLLPSEVIPGYYQIVQTEGYVLIFTEWMHDARIVRIGGTHASPAVRSWLGDSIGHYEGASLVIDTTNFRRDTHSFDSGERLHVVERLTRVDARTLSYRVTVDDPETWATAWTAEWPFKTSDARMFGVDCHEGNYSMENTLRGARAEERRRREAGR
jgi:hypothetical protein